MFQGGKEQGYKKERGGDEGTQEDGNRSAWEGTGG